MPPEKKVRGNAKKREQEESECLGRAAQLPSLFPSQLVALVICRLCFASHILMLSYFDGASAILKLQLNRVCFGCSSDAN